MPGPLPSAQARRRNATSAFRVLPPSRSGRAPAWPLPVRAPAGGTKLWRELWATPMAVEWEKLGYPHVVARYVVVFLRSLEESDLLGEARQLEDKLGLTPWSMLRNRWLVEPPDPDAKRATPRVKHSGSVVQLRPTRTADASD